MELSEYGVLDMDDTRRVPLVVGVTYDPQAVLGELLCALWYD